MKDSGQPGHLPREERIVESDVLVTIYTGLTCLRD